MFLGVEEHRALVRQSKVSSYLPHFPPVSPGHLTGGRVLGPALSPQPHTRAGIHLPGRAGHGAEPAPSWHPAPGCRMGLIRCLIFKMFTNFTDSFLAKNGNSSVVPGGVCGPCCRSAACRGLCRRGWRGRGPEPTRPCQACSCSPSRAIPTAAQVILSLCSPPLGRLQAFDSRGLSGHFGSSRRCM